MDFPVPQVVSRYRSALGDVELLGSIHDERKVFLFHSLTALCCLSLPPRINVFIIVIRLKKTKASPKEGEDMKNMANRSGLLGSRLQ